MVLEITLNVVGDDTNETVKKLDGKKTPLKFDITDYDDFVDKISEFVWDELEDNGVYEFDEWDENASMIQIDDDADDRSYEEILTNYEDVVKKVKNFLDKEGFVIKF
jgi:hypothetical protein